MSKLDEEVSQAQLKDLEKFADRLLNKFDVDVEFTKHFAERMNDSRNKPPIKIAELQALFKKIANVKAKNIKAYPNSEVVLKDMQKDLNLPIVIRTDKQGDIEVTHKTIMRKKNFTTPNPIVRYEEINRDFITLLNSKSQKVTRALEEKANNSGIPMNTILSVYNRGLVSYSKDIHGRYLPEQYAFARVNSFIKGGRARVLDNDLIEHFALQLIRGSSYDTLKIWENNKKAWLEVRGKPGYEIGGYDKTDPLHNFLDILGKGVNVSELMNGEKAYLNPNNPRAMKAISKAKELMKEEYVSLKEASVSTFSEWTLQNPSEKWHSKTNQRVIKLKKKGDMHHPSDTKDADTLHAVTGKSQLSHDDLKYAHGVAHRQGYKLHVE